MSLYLLNLELKAATEDCNDDFNRYLYDQTLHHTSDFTTSIWPFTENKSMSNRIDLVYLKDPISTNNPAQYNWRIVNVGERKVGLTIWEVSHVTY
jgi:hypothetical protein